MLNRRIFISQLCAGGAAVLVSGCGGGGSLGAPASSALAPSPSPSPAPPPVQAPPVPTLMGVTIDAAEADIMSGVMAVGSWFQAARAPHREVVVTNASDFQRAVDEAFDTERNAQTLALNHRIVCAWNGDSALPGEPTLRITIGKKLLASSHMDQGGSLEIVAGEGQRPSFPNTVYVSARGVKFQGVGFTRRAQPQENPDTVSAVALSQNQTFPIDAAVSFQKCFFGHADETQLTPSEAWVNGISTLGGVARHVTLEGCVFCGLQNGAKVISRSLRVDQCDLQQCRQDGIPLYGHAQQSDYYALVAISRTTFRNWTDDFALRAEHTDAIQTGTRADIHQGYRVLITDTVVHMGRSYGGTQGLYNDDHLTADNQFVLRRNFFLVTAPRGFTYYSPQASRPSFIDRCTFMRAGRVPSAFAPDTNSYDWTVMISQREAATDTSKLMVTNSIAKNGIDSQNSNIDITSVDPRVIGRAPDSERPEVVFRGRDFGRSVAPVNFVAGKFGYALPGERAGPTRFAQDVWANFEPISALSGKGAPDPRGIAWQS